MRVSLRGQKVKTSRIPISFHKLFWNSCNDTGWNNFFSFKLSLNQTELLLISCIVIRTENKIGNNLYLMMTQIKEILNLNFILEEKKDNNNNI